MSNDSITHLAQGPSKHTNVFSPRESTILSLAATGLADKQIAREIGISMGTVRTYWQRMRDKTNARSRSEIISVAHQRAHSQAIEALHQLKDQLSAIIEASAVGLALLDESYRIIEANGVFASIVGLNQLEIKGLCIYTLASVHMADDTAVEPVAVLEIDIKPNIQVRHLVSKQQIWLQEQLFHVITLLPITH